MVRRRRIRATAMSRNQMAALGRRNDWITVTRRRSQVVTRRRR